MELLALGLGAMTIKTDAGKTNDGSFYEMCFRGKMKLVCRLSIARLWAFLISKSMCKRLVHKVFKLDLLLLLASFVLVTERFE